MLEPARNGKEQVLRLMSFFKFTQAVLTHDQSLQWLVSLSGSGLFGMGSSPISILTKAAALRILLYTSCVACMEFRRPEPRPTMHRAMASVKGLTTQCMICCGCSPLCRRVIGLSTFLIWCSVITPLSTGESPHFLMVGF